MVYIITLHFLIAYIKLATDLTDPEEIDSHLYQKFKKRALKYLQTRVLNNK